MKAFIIHPDDNVATALEALTPGTAQLLGARTDSLYVAEAVREGHKISLRAIPKDEAVIKFGIRIGHASTDIPAGSWIHLHNLHSDYDERSQTLDGETGAPTEDVYV
ncbi:MAG: altronate dehydratase small subunit [Kiritimatiellia bacterium]|jgi:altronate dehydratase small subunit